MILQKGLVKFNCLQQNHKQRFNAVLWKVMIFKSNKYKSAANGFHFIHFVAFHPNNWPDYKYATRDPAVFKLR